MQVLGAAPFRSFTTGSAENDIASERRSIPRLELEPSSRNARGLKTGSFGSSMAGLNRLRKGAMDGVETGFSQNGAAQYFGVNRESIHVDVRAAGGVCYLLWGEPGFSSIGGWVLGAGSYACTRARLEVAPWYTAPEGGRS